MLRAIQVAFRAAETDANMLVLGLSGTGKSVLAREIHKRSARREAAFVTVNCPSLSRELFESELFGHAGVVHGCGRRDLRQGGRGRRGDALPR